jgi:ribosomal protein L24E
MRNRYKGDCYFCGKEVLPGAGHFERYRKGWRVIHAGCVFRMRDMKLSQGKASLERKKLREVIKNG